ncbi:hypothetical protein GY14_12300 [Delftia tsuruhatensis]|nr:hypothetical protein GY14_12300 [Delftia tsuruhatensis]
MSLTWKDPRGGTKKKSKHSTDSSAAQAPGPRPQRNEDSTTMSRNSITTLAGSKMRSSCSASTVAVKQARVTPA